MNDYELVLSKYPYAHVVLSRDLRFAIWCFTKDGPMSISEFANTQSAAWANAAERLRENFK